MNFLLTNRMLPLALCMLISDVLFLGYGVMSSSLVLDQDKVISRCQYSKAYSLLQVDCSSRNLENVPPKIDSNVQVLDLTFNRITELPPGSFSRYTRLEYLYIGQNFIFEITNDTVEELGYLQLLDLSKNQLKALPSTLFRSPYLRMLYLTKNKLEDSAFNFEINTPLEILEIADNHLTKIPSLGIISGLTTLNLSKNAISQISIEDVAPFCSLKILDLRNNPIKFNQQSCDCYHFHSWVEMRNLKVKPLFPCNNDTFDSCSRVPFSNETMETYTKCLDVIAVQKAAVKARTTWTTVGSCVGVFLVCLLIGVYCVYKRNAKRNRKSKEAQKLAANNANTELLNGNLPDQLPIKTLHE